MSVWDEHAARTGRRSVISPGISEEEFDAVTATQAPAVEKLIKRELYFRPRDILDFGCGPGRFLPMLSRLLLTDGTVYAYDPTTAFLAYAQRQPTVSWAAFTPLIENVLSRRYSIVFSWLVLGGVDDAEAQALVETIAGIVETNGIVFIGEHCEEEKQTGRWWRFRPLAFYRDAFAARGVELSALGDVDQLGNAVTLFAGRRRRLANAFDRPYR